MKNRTREHFPLLLSSSIRATSATIISPCCYYVTLLRASISVVVIFHSFGLSSSSILQNFSPIVFCFAELLSHFLPLLLPLPFLRKASTAAVIFYFVRLSQLPTFPTAVIVFLCCRCLVFVQYLLSDPCDICVIGKSDHHRNVRPLSSISAIKLHHHQVTRAPWVMQRE
ncbi:hypothetical protein CDAR_484431 [Caerostris darwini]|uniref:Uncharacterized protein n=1 Tax=Caerostris darwini TaxID=1538125 RepID=A0AAV4NXP8_9ARAC|nr:hypothetical protein CDAR_484431 [Caerostris darwini]